MKNFIVSWSSYKMSENYFKKRDILGFGGIFGKFGKIIAYVFRISYYKTWMLKINKIVNNGLLLDVGCGLGYSLHVFKKKFNTIGIDISEFAIRSHINKKFTTIIMSAEALGFKDNSFNVINCFDVIEHLNNPNAFLKDAYRILKNGGVMLISTPNVKSLAVEKLGNRWHGFLDKTHVSLMSPEKWISSLLKNKYHIHEIFSDGFFYLISRNNKRFFLILVKKYLMYFIMGIFSQVIFLLFKRLPPIGENICFILIKKEEKK